MAPLSSQMWYLGLTSADPARMRLFGLYLGQMLYDQLSLLVKGAWLYVALKNALSFHNPVRTKP